MSNIPGLSDTMYTALVNGLQGKFPNNLGAIRCIRRTWSHRVAVGSALAASTQFFNVNSSKGVWNGPPNGTIQNDQFMLCTSAQIQIIAGTAVSGAVDADGATSSRAATGSSVPAVVQEWLKNAHDQGVVSLRVGDFAVLDQVPGLRTFPMPNGPSGFGGVWGTTSTMEAAISQFNNGGPGAVPYRLAPAFPILPGLPMLGYIDYIGTPPAIPSSFDGFFDFRLDGWFFTGR